jgi:hypothetical protein
MSRVPLPLLLASVLPLLASVGCAPKIGNICSNALDCSAQGSRLCDRTQPGGYCTIAMCEEGTCPAEAVCVKFRPQQERLALTYCMRKCSDNSDCRHSEGYRCTAAQDFGEKGVGDALILGDPAQRFCSIPALVPSAMSAPPRRTQSQGDGGESPDASAH